MILVRTHGGLGNQLFQIGHALLRARRSGGGPVVRRHDIRYPVVFPATPLFADLDQPAAVPARALSWLRIPKLLSRAGFRCDALGLGGWTLLDGYFQRAADWQAPPADIAAVVAELRHRCGITPGAGAGTLVHLRLGDFFADEASQTAHLAARLADLPPGATLISNRDDLLARQALLLAAGGHLHVPTTDLSPEALLRLMAGFGEIQSNDSTLAVWAALLGRARIAIRHPPLCAVHAAIAAAD